MKNHTQYLYSFANASLTLRVIEHLRNSKLLIDSVTVVNLVDRWLVKINLKHTISLNSAKNLQAFLNEMGICDHPSAQVINAIAKLEAGESPIEVMNRYRVAIVAYGEPEQEEIQIFREQIVERLGYCPQNMA